MKSWVMNKTMKSPEDFCSTWQKYSDCYKEHVNSVKIV